MPLPNVDFKSPVSMFRLFLVMIVVFVLVALAWDLQTIRSIEARSRASSETAELAQLASDASDHLRALTQIAQQREDEAAKSPEIAGLSEGQLRVVTSWLIGDSQVPPTSTIANISAPLSMQEAIQFQSTVDYLRDRLTTLLAGTTDPALRQDSQELSGKLDAAIQLYYQSPTLDHLHEMRLGLGAQQVATQIEVPSLTAAAAKLRADMSSSIRFLGWQLFFLATIGGATILILGTYMSRTTQHLLYEARTEQADMASLTKNLEYRNQQLNALYNVFNEITDTLSLRYVVKATMFESLKIMRADMVVLRIVRGNELEIAGAMLASGQEIEELPAVKLGEGPTGRTAKRGRTLRIDEGGENMMAPPDATDPENAPSRRANQAALLESGLIVPLIVGARVVGTISCWSREKFSFNDEDQRVLEMMASQVATAIVAADTTEKSERRAHQDPLTGLPNRRQLDEDIKGDLSEMAEGGRNAVIAMVDIDHFKHFNDDYGHHVGDVTLQKVAAVLRSAARDQDRVYRYGGEEFVIVFTDSGRENAVSLADRVRLAVEGTPISGEHLEPVGPVTVSVGVSLLPDQGIDLEELINLADRAMYKAKLNGRNRVELWEGVEPSTELNSVA
jgi:diguanylate cyclase (GGDEF)-like protein